MQWRIELFGGLRVFHEHRVITRFRTQKTGALLGYLAFKRDRKHSRELLAEMFWPGCSPEAGRQSLSKAISSLRHQLEPPGVTAGTVLVADRFLIGLNPASVSTDVGDFQSAIRSAETAANALERQQLRMDAVALYQGDLLAGYYEEWILPEQRRMAEAFFQTLRQLIQHLEKAGELMLGIEYARLGIRIDPQREEAHYDLIRLLKGAGQTVEALRQSRELKQMLKREMSTAAGPDPISLDREIERTVGARDLKQIYAPPSARDSPGSAQPHSMPISGRTLTILLADMADTAVLKQ